MRCEHNLPRGVGREASQGFARHVNVAFYLGLVMSESSGLVLHDQPIQAQQSARQRTEAHGEGVAARRSRQSSELSQARKFARDPASARRER